MSPKRTTTSLSDLGDLIPDFARSLRAANKSPKTVKVYIDAATRLLTFLKDNEMPTAVSEIRRAHVEAFMEQQLGQGSPSTANQRYRSLAQLWNFLIEEEEIEISPMAKMKAPKVPEKPVPIVSENHLKRLLSACSGSELEDRRDHAMIRMLIATGMRASELVGMRIEDLDREAQVAFVLGKGRRPRACPYGAKTALAIDRYLRVRYRHRLADSEWLWIGKYGRITDSGLRQIVERRARLAGVPHIHPHQLRHTYAHEFLAGGGNEGDLMVLAGWRSRQMLQRYGASAAGDRARAAYQRRPIGDDL